MIRTGSLSLNGSIAAKKYDTVEFKGLFQAVKGHKSFTYPEVIKLDTVVRPGGQKLSHASQKSSVASVEPEEFDDWVRQDVQTEEMLTLKQQSTKLDSSLRANGWPKRPSRDGK